MSNSLFFTSSIASCKHQKGPDNREILTSQSLVRF
uniref:Uncharacterized protein n=1 Tax=Arundo donax TaxID=35708 RepID=A0A0A8YGQ9_ARUDO